jgi:S1-C subfamily serine protease
VENGRVAAIMAASPARFPHMDDTPRRAPVSCSPWALILLLVLAAAYLGSRLAAPLLTRTHDPEATPRPVQARGDLAQDEQSTIQLFRQASPSVVHIDTGVTVYDRWTLTPLTIPQGTGSGFVWDDRGYIVTNFHVIRDASQATVSLEGGASFEARLVGYREDNDIAVLKIDTTGAKLPAIAIGTSKDLQVGQKVFAIGNPFGLDHTLTTGIISGLGRQITSISGRPIRDVIQTDAAINPGNSGGPLLDSAGRLIGMNTAIASPPGVGDGQGFNVGVGFAVPVDTINKEVPGLIRNGSFVPPQLGIVSAPDQVAQALGVDGVVVKSVEPGSGAERAGMRSLEYTRGRGVRADVITSVDGKPVSSIDDIRQVLFERKTGDVVQVEIQREGKKRTLDVTLK